MTFDIKKCLVVATVGDRVPAIRRLWHQSAFCKKPLQCALSVINYGKMNWHANEQKWPGYKWRNINRLMSLEDWDYVWFPDDDNDISPRDVERLFELAHKHDFQLCQPSMSADSTEIGWDVCRHVPGSEARPTNFVEVMCPLFSREALEACRPTFDVNYSGWGLDFVWPKLLDYKRIGVVDAVQVRHTEPGASPSWKFPNGKTSREELDETLAKYGLDYETCRANVRNL